MVAGGEYFSYLLQSAQNFPSIQGEATGATGLPLHP